MPFHALQGCYTAATMVVQAPAGASALPRGRLLTTAALSMLRCAMLRCAAQVAFADKCLLNKIDLVTPAEKHEVIDRIKVGMGAGFC